MRGASPRAIQELAGYTDLQTTQRYRHLAPATLREAIGLARRGWQHSGSAEGQFRKAE